KPDTPVIRVPTPRASQGKEGYLWNARTGTEALPQPRIGSSWLARSSCADSSRSRCPFAKNARQFQIPDSHPIAYRSSSLCQVGARLSPDRNTSVDEDGVNDVDEPNIRQSLTEKVERVLASDDPCAANPRCIGRNACPSDKDFIGCGSCIADHNACRDYSGIIGTNSCVAPDYPGDNKDSSPCSGNGWLGGEPLDGRIANQACHALMAWDMDYIRPSFAMPSGLTMMTVAAMRFARMSGRHPKSGPTRAWETGPVTRRVRFELTRYKGGDFVAHDGAKACADNTGSVGNQACQGDMSCHKNKGKIDNESCLGFHACFENKGEVGKGSCIAKDSCNGNTGKIGKNACTLVGSCANNDKDIPDDCPSRDQLTKCENQGATCPC
ncbi:hypothetical protein THAOC_07515, partial [Thalassiosira oceanica]